MRKALTRWVAVAAVLAAVQAVSAAEPVPTTITVPDLHCAGCAKGVTAKLSAVQGVKEVKVDLEAKTFTVTPQAQTVLSPRALWEAVEKAKKQPTKLEGPGGKFTEKPKA